MSTLLWAAAILDSASKVLPLVVAVSGRVVSDTPRVIVEETVSTDVLFSSHYIFIVTSRCFFY
jgi:hypothetical protein